MYRIIPVNSWRYSPSNCALAASRQIQSYRISAAKDLLSIPSRQLSQLIPSPYRIRDRNAKQNNQAIVSLELTQISTSFPSKCNLTGNLVNHIDYLPSTSIETRWQENGHFPIRPEHKLFFISFASIPSSVLPSVQRLSQAQHALSQEPCCYPNPTLELMQHAHLACSPHSPFTTNKKTGDHQHKVAAAREILNSDSRYPENRSGELGHDSNSRERYQGELREAKRAKLCARQS